MLFYKIYGLPVAGGKDETVQTVKGESRRIKPDKATSRFNATIRGSGFVCFESIEKDEICLVALGKTGNEIRAHVGEYLVYTEHELDDPAFEEITFREFEDRLLNAHCNGFVEQPELVLTDNSLSDIRFERGPGRGRGYLDKLVDVVGRDRIIENLGKRFTRKR